MPDTTTRPPLAAPKSSTRLPDQPHRHTLDPYEDEYVAGTRMRPEHLVAAVLHEAMLHIRMQGLRLQHSHIQYGTGPAPRTCRRRWRHRKPPFTPPQAAMAPVWMVADLLHNSVGYLTDETSHHHGITPGIEALIMMTERIPQTPRTLDDLHLRAFVERALRGTGWTVEDMCAHSAALAAKLT